MSEPESRGAELRRRLLGSPDRPGPEPGPEPDPFARWRRPDDPPDILPEIIAARCLGISYGDPGPPLPADTCRQCWGERHIWLGNTWGLKHAPPGFDRCGHECHAAEVWLG